MAFLRRTDHITSGRNSSHLMPVTASMSGQASAGTRSFFQRETDALETFLPLAVRSSARRDEPPTAAQARSNADFSVTSIMVAEYDTPQLRLAQLPSCNDGWASYALLDMEFAAQFGERLRKARTAKGLTQTTLGEKLAIKKANVSQWENGHHMPDLEQLAALCDATGMSADWMLGRTQKELSAEALSEAHAYDSLSAEEQRKWRALRMTMFTPA